MPDTTGDRSYVAENDVARARLKAFVGSLSDDDIVRSIGHGWTEQPLPIH